MNQTMFCYQCQETAGCTGCTRVGVCGKKPDLAAMQDLLVFVTKGLSAVTTQLRAEGVEISTDINHLITLNLFVTITNANFDKTSIKNRIKDTLLEKERLLNKLGDDEKKELPEAALWNGDENEFEKKAKEVIAHDDIIDDLFIKSREDVISLIRSNPEEGACATDLLMIAKYFERIGDHACNIAEWVIFSITGEHKKK